MPFQPQSYQFKVLILEGQIFYTKCGLLTKSKSGKYGNIQLILGLEWEQEYSLIMGFNYIWNSKPGFHDACMHKCSTPMLKKICHSLFTIIWKKTTLPSHSGKCNIGCVQTFLTELYFSEGQSA